MPEHLARLFRRTCANGQIDQRRERRYTGHRLFVITGAHYESWLRWYFKKALAAFSFSPQELARASTDAPTLRRHPGKSQLQGLAAPADVPFNSALRHLSAHAHQKDVNLRFVAPQAQTVSVVFALRGQNNNIPGAVQAGDGFLSLNLIQQADGCWACTVPGRPHGEFVYCFNVDGVETTDPKSQGIITIEGRGKFSLKQLS